MSLPPDRISVKRRRQDEPVDVLYLDNDDQQNKRRFTDFYFQRLKATNYDTHNVDQRLCDQLSLHGTNGSSGPKVPIVQVTTPTEEISARTWRSIDHVRSSVQGGKKSDVSNSPHKSVSTGRDGMSEARYEARRAKDGSHLRRFELAHMSVRDGDRRSFSLDNTSSKPRSHLATFMEKDAVDNLADSEISFEPANINNRPILVENQSLDASIRKKPGPSFMRSGEQSVSRVAPTNYLTGSNGLKEAEFENSDRPHLLHWDYESDELAKDLENIALEIIREEGIAETRQDESATSRQVQQSIEEPTSDNEEDYVYETYVRKHFRNDEVLAESAEEGSCHVGYLVIHETEQGQWETYVENDDSADMDKDDYDSNAEDNPANDYPEFDSDDEFDHDE